LFLNSAIKVGSLVFKLSGEKQRDRSEESLLFAGSIADVRNIIVNSKGESTKGHKNQT